MTLNDPFRPFTPEELQVQANASNPLQKDDGQIILPVPDNALAPEFIHSQYGKPSQKWLYTNVAREPLCYVCRFDLPNGSKQVLPLSYWCDDKGYKWRWKGLPAPRPLYGLYRLALNPTAPVLIVEGEKTATAAQKRFTGFVCVTSLGGAAHSDWRPLASREVTIWPDADEPGLKYANEVAQSAFKVGANSVSIVNVEGLPPKWDLADDAPEGVDIEAMLKAAEPAEVIDTTAPHYISCGEFEMSERGLTIEVETGRGQNKTIETKWICRAFEVIGRARDPHGEGWAGAKGSGKAWFNCGGG